MAIDDGFNRFIADGTNGLEQNFAVVLAVTSIKGNEALVGIDNSNRGESITTKYPDALNRLFDRRLEPGNLLDAIQERLVGNRSVGRFDQFHRATHVRAYLIRYGTADATRMCKHYHRANQRKYRRGFHRTVPIFASFSRIMGLFGKCGLVLLEDP